MNLDEFCRRFHLLMEEKLPVMAMIEKGRSIVGELVSDAEWFHDILEKMLFDRQYLDGQRASIWPNEITLYRSPDKSFVALAYFWEAHAADNIHDHGSWGIVGELINPSIERKFRRLDDGKTDGYAVLEETSARVLSQGDTTFVLPLDKGIHQMENLTDQIAVSINVYGRIIRKGYAQYFYPDKKSVARIFPPRTLKEVLAVRVLGAIDRPWAEDMLRARMHEPLTDLLKKECEDTLSHINSSARAREK